MARILRVRKSGESAAFPFIMRCMAEHLPGRINEAEASSQFLTATIHNHPESLNYKHDDGKTMSTYSFDNLPAPVWEGLTNAAYAPPGDGHQEAAGLAINIANACAVIEVHKVCWSLFNKHKKLKMNRARFNCLRMMHVTLSILFCPYAQM